MTKVELVAKVHESMINNAHESVKDKMTKAMAEKVVDAMFASIKDEFLAGHDVTVTGFGSFKVKTRSAREARNPRTGETVHVEEKKTITFKPVAKLKGDLNK